MIPAVNTAVEISPLLQDETNYYDTTYNLNYKDAVVSGYTSGKNALVQSIYRMLSTERYEFPIYSDNYGIGISDLYGKPIGLIMSEVKRKIIDCLKTDDRIVRVDDFKFKQNYRSLFVEFKVTTKTDGEITFSKEVDI